MAILQKRTSSKKIPEAAGLNRAPLNSIINGVSGTPALSQAAGNSSLTSSVTKPRTTLSQSSSSAPSSTAIPAVTIKTPTTAKTTSPSTMVKQTIQPSKGGTSAVTSKLMNAATGAAIGAGSKFLIDKLIGPAKEAATKAAGTRAAAAKEAKAKEEKAAADKKAEENKVLTDAEVDNEIDRVVSEAEPFGPPEGAVDNGDGTFTTRGGGVATTYNKAGEVINMEADVKSDASTDTGATRSLSGTEVTVADKADTPSFEGDTQYFQDENGNIYSQNADGGYDLYRAAEVIDAADNTYTVPDTGTELTLSDSEDQPTNVADNSVEPNVDYTDNFGDYEVRRGGLITMMNQGGEVKGYDEGGVVNDNDDGTYSYYAANGDYITVDEFGNEMFRTGEDGKVIESNNEPAITNAGGGDRDWYKEYIRPIISGGKSLAQDALSGIQTALGTPLGAAGAGALVSTLLNQNFGGDASTLNKGLDMSKVGVINPRTTDFGIGPTNFVGYDKYGAGGGDYVPNEELLRNLNAPGFNPVNEGDYGYETAVAPPKLASGGLSAMPVASYYTFGQPADILANLGMRAQPPVNPPDMAAQQSQQGTPQMRSGGLPHVVPMIQGRMDFRQGSAVHGEGDGQSDDIPAMLADGEYVIDAETVAQIGNGSTKAGAQALDKFREGIRAHKRSTPINKIPPKTKALTSYLKG